MCKRQQFVFQKVPDNKKQNKDTEIATFLGKNENKS